MNSTHPPSLFFGSYLRHNHPDTNLLGIPTSRPTGLTPSPSTSRGHSRQPSDQASDRASIASSDAFSRGSSPRLLTTTPVGTPPFHDTDLSRAPSHLPSPFSSPASSPRHSRQSSVAASPLIQSHIPLSFPAYEPSNAHHLPSLFLGVLETLLGAAHINSLTPAHIHQAVEQSNHYRNWQALQTHNPELHRQVLDSQIKHPDAIAFIAASNTETFPRLTFPHMQTNQMLLSTDALEAAENIVLERMMTTTRPSQMFQLAATANERHNAAVLASNDPHGIRNALRRQITYDDINAVREHILGTSSTPTTSQASSREATPERNVRIRRT